MIDYLDAPKLQLPIACEVGKTCEVQNYVDRDPGSGLSDYMCGTTTYDQHNGVDFRVPSVAAQRAGVPVLAAAKGRVARVRDGVEDLSVRERGRGAVQGAECGNGLVIDHGGGWETQYCHMAKGSLHVRPGQDVEAGSPVGAVGLSGLTEYPHLHFTVRFKGNVVDPFSLAGGTCGKGRSLWSPQAEATLNYSTRIVLNAGFADRPITNELIEAGELEGLRPKPTSSALVAYVRVIGVKEGDSQSFTLRGPGGQIVAESKAAPLDRDKAQWTMFIGRKSPPGGWVKGLYEAKYLIEGGGKILNEKIFVLKIE